jgi:hypothetical protein
MNATVNSPMPSPSLQRQLAETERLEALVEALKTEHFQMGQHFLKSSWHRGFDDYYSQRREVYVKLIFAEADLVRSKAKEAALINAIARREAAMAVSVPA